MLFAGSGSAAVGFLRLCGVEASARVRAREIVTPGRVHAHARVGSIPQTPQSRRDAAAARVEATCIPATTPQAIPQTPISRARAPNLSLETPEIGEGKVLGD